MASTRALVAIRLLPVLSLTLAAVAYVFHIEGADTYLWRNVLPMVITLALAYVTLKRGAGRWTGSGWCWPLGTLGFAIPAIGLSLYLHYGYATDMHGMYSDAIYPQELFRFLPMYTIVAGGLGFAIGWIAGRNV